MAPAEDVLSGVPTRANDDEHRDTPLPPTKQSGRAFRGWYDEQSKGGKVAFILSTTLAVLLVLGVIIGAASGSGSGESHPYLEHKAESEQSTGTLEKCEHEWMEGHPGDASELDLNGTEIVGPTVPREELERACAS